MVRIFSALGVIFAVLFTSDVFVNRATLKVFFCLTLSCIHGVVYGKTKELLHSNRIGISLTDFKSEYYAERSKREISLPEAKLELMLMLDPDISNYIDTDYAKIEFCRLFSAVQEIFDSIKERKVVVEFSALHFEKNEENANYIHDNILDENGTLDVFGAIYDMANAIQLWDKEEYDAYLLLTRRPLVLQNGSTTVTYESGYSMTGGACQSGNNIAIAKYSLKDITHQITHLLGAAHIGEEISAINNCPEDNYITEVVGDDAVIQFVKGFSNCTISAMNDFLRNGNATCLYTQNITDGLDCDNIIPEIH